MGKTYDNTIIEAETSLGIERILVADHPASWDPSTGKIDYSFPPAGFTDLGAVVEDTPAVTVTREKFQLKLGLPKALQYEQIIGVEGGIIATIYAKTNDVVEKALGVAKVDISTLGDRIPFGGTSIHKFAVLGVADFVDGTQVVHHFPECSVKPEFVENVRPDDAGKISLGFDAYSFISTIHNDERVVGERVYFE